MHRKFAVSEMLEKRYRIVPIDPRNVNESFSNSSKSTKSIQVKNALTNDTHRHWFKEIYSIALGMSTISEENIKNLS